MDQRKDNLGFLLNKATRLLKWELDKCLKAYDLTTPQWSVLIDLSMQKRLNSSDVSPAALAERLNMDRPTISGIINRLLKKDLVSTKENPEDRRYQIVTLTKKADSLIPELERLSDSIINTATTGFEDEDLNALKKYLITVINNLS